MSMAIDITGVSKTPLSGTKTEARKATPSYATDPNISDSRPAKGTENVSNSFSADKVTLTPQAKELRMIEKAINDQTDVDNERIKSLKLEIDTGRYDIDAQRVAEKLIQFEMQFVA